MENFYVGIFFGILLKIFGKLQEKIKVKLQKDEWESQSLIIFSIFDSIIVGVLCSTGGWTVIFTGLINKI